RRRGAAPDQDVGRPRVPRYLARDSAADARPGRVQPRDPDALHAAPGRAVARGARHRDPLRRAGELPAGGDTRASHFPGRRVTETQRSDALARFHRALVEEILRSRPTYLRE